jgi:4-diphosphocytidyl-2-C-methyl-D-erythritol kinase
MGRTWRAPAKLNLYLHVVGRRPDGYHLLDSLVAFADIGDDIEAQTAADLSLRVTGPFAGALDGSHGDNLMWRAAFKLAEALDRSPQAALTLVKNLPVASGIGGGSSDAAATLRALIDLWDASPAPDVLMSLAAGLGADVPVCFAARTAWLGGIGETVVPAPALPATYVVLANPGLPLSTPAVFKARRGGFSAPARFDAAAPDAATLGALLADRRNDLTDAAVGLLPEIAVLLAALAAQEGVLLARMSGSGATCFGLFAEQGAAAVAAARLQREQPTWWVASGRLL